MTDAGKASIREKLHARLTKDRRERFARETEASRAIAAEVRKKAANAFAQRYGLIIQRMQQQGMGLTEIARKLTDAGHVSRRGKPWTDQTVRQTLKRFEPIVKLRGVSSEVLGNVIHREIHTADQKRLIGWGRKT